MKKLIVILIVLGFGWYGNQKYHVYQTNPFSEVPTSLEFAATSEPNETSQNRQFNCDGRTHCSQMTSCEEATFFIKNCPNTKMDGNNDGIPCEKQWCK